jgi:hypothetical protein
MQQAHDPIHGDYYINEAINEVREAKRDVDLAQPQCNEPIGLFWRLRRRYSNSLYRQEKDQAPRLPGDIFKPIFLFMHEVFYLGYPQSGFATMAGSIE